MHRFLKILFVIPVMIMSCGSLFAATCTSEQYAVGDTCYSCPANASCDGVNFNCDDEFYRNVAVCSACPPNSTCTSPIEFSCNPGTYLRDGQCNVCPDNATCVGGNAEFHCNGGWYKTVLSCESCAGHQCDGDTERYECPARQTTTGYGVGADQAADCGVIWHIGGQEVRLRSERRTDPRLCVQINDNIFFADMTPVSEGAHGNIRIEVNGIVYSVYNADLQ